MVSGRVKSITINDHAIYGLWTDLLMGDGNVLCCVICEYIVCEMIKGRDDVVTGTPITRPHFDCRKSHIIPNDWAKLWNDFDYFANSILQCSLWFLRIVSALIHICECVCVLYVDTFDEIGDTNEISSQ